MSDSKIPKMIKEDTLFKELSDKNKPFYKKLEILRSNSAMSKATVAKKLNFKYQTYFSWENGRVIPKIDNIKKIADFYHIPYSLLLPERYVTKSYTENKIDIETVENVPFYYPYQLTFENSFDDQVTKQEASIYAINNRVPLQCYFALKVKGHSMSVSRRKSINEGSIVYCNKNFDANIFLTETPIMVVVCKGELEALIREVMIEDDKVILTPWNENYTTKILLKEEVKFLGKVESVLTFI